MSTQIIILAAGEGKRMNSESPKPMVTFLGKPMIAHLLSSVMESGLCTKPIIIVGQRREEIIDFLGPSFTYVVQEEQLGTGHAVMTAESAATGHDTVLVLYADHPLVSSHMISNLAKEHSDSGATLTMAVATVPDFSDWRKAFYSFGRIVRDQSGEILKIIELKDASEEEKEIKEVNPSYFCFNAAWLWENLHKLKNNNNQKEYYLTDLVGLARDQNVKIASIEIDPKEALGVNTREQLELLESLPS
jgi:bifunctional UDP-N-acetylglucosamine pyrophosphorylase / glucosamine-1-phosphate N-acetyltransferase